jgi:oligoribonuclease
MGDAKDRLLWVDCEMTGLRPGFDQLIEIAALVTDGELNIIDDGIDLVIHAEEDVLAHMDEYVTNMHASSGLTDAVRASALSLAEAEARVLAYVKERFPAPRTAILAGNSIATDRSFLAKDMPELDAWLHYRMVDVSTIKELSRRWYPRIYFNQPEKGLAHRALADIVESVRELRYYRSTAFVAPPGPTSEEIESVVKGLATD